MWMHYSLCVFVWSEKRLLVQHGGFVVSWLYWQRDQLMGCVRVCVCVMCTLSLEFVLGVWWSSPAWKREWQGIWEREGAVECVCSRCSLWFLLANNGSWSWCTRASGSPTTVHVCLHGPHRRLSESCTFFRWNCDCSSEPDCSVVWLHLCWHGLASSHRQFVMGMCFTVLLAAYIIISSTDGFWQHCSCQYKDTHNVL